MWNKHKEARSLVRQQHMGDCLDLQAGLWAEQTHGGLQTRRTGRKASGTAGTDGDLQEGLEMEIYEIYETGTKQFLGVFLSHGVSHPSCISDTTDFCMSCH